MIVVPCDQLQLFLCSTMSFYLLASPFFGTARYLLVAAERNGEVSDFAYDINKGLSASFSNNHPLRATVVILSFMQIESEVALL